MFLILIQPEVGDEAEIFNHPKKTYNGIFKIISVDQKGFYMQKLEEKPKRITYSKDYPYFIIYPHGTLSEKRKRFLFDAREKKK